MDKEGRREKKQKTIEHQEDVFTCEFRHEQVGKFVIGLLNGSTKISSGYLGIDEKTKNTLIDLRVELLVDIEKYVSGKLKGEELD